LVANLQIPVFDGFATTNRVAAAEDSYEAAKLNLDWQKFQLERDVILQFYRAVAAEQLLAVAKQSQKALEDHLKDTRLFKGAGMSTHYDVLRVEVQASEARSEVMNTEDNVAIARIKLAELMGENLDVNSVQSRVPEGQLPQLKIDLIKMEVDKIKAAHSGNAQHFIQRKDLEALQLKLDGLSKSASAASRHYFPKLSLFAQYQYYNNKNNKFADAASYRNAYSTGVSLTGSPRRLNLMKLLAKNQSLNTLCKYAGSGLWWTLSFGAANFYISSI
jgi:outer membrane protein TolC